MPITNKIISREEAKNIALSLKNSGKTIVFTNGCFDILHAGHIELLEKAKSFGDILILGLNTDKSIKIIKGENRPLNIQIDRARVIAALELVDYVVLFDESTPCEIISKIKPDIHVKGGDYDPTDFENMPEAEVINEYGGKIEVVPLLKTKSTTNIIKKISKLQ